MKKMRTLARYFLQVIFLIIVKSLTAQDYRAINGSPYAGSLAAANNPASIVHVPFAWDITPLAFQFKQLTNAINLSKVSYVSKWKNAVVNSNNGTFERFLMANQDLRLLNARIRLNCNSAIAFGASARSYFSAKTTALNWQDSLGPLREFMGINLNNTPMSGQARANIWTEVFGTYARTIMVYDDAILNAGITVKLNTGIAGGYMNAIRFEEAPGTVNNQPGYYLTNGKLDYGYSSNVDVLDTATSFGNAKKDFFKNTNSSVAISLGAEYIVSGSGEEENGYSLKIGVSLLDLGMNRFQYSDYSRSAVLNKKNVSDTLIGTSFGNTDGPASFADTLQSLAGSIKTFTGKFRLFQPARLVINADKHITDNFFINADLTLPLLYVLGNKQLFVRDMNFISLTPRYETKTFGIYLPVSLSTQMNFWVGGAVKTGPFLLGFHNLANLLIKNKVQNGGAYLAFTFRFKGKNQTCSDTDNVKGQSISNKKTRQFSCPGPVQ